MRSIKAKDTLTLKESRGLNPLQGILVKSGLASAGHREGKHLGAGHTAPYQGLLALRQPGALTSLTASP